MKRNVIQHLAIALLLTSSMHALAAEEELTSQEKVGIGLMHALKNEKREAWAYLLPEAKAGNVDAMFHLGQLLIKSPEYEGHLKKAAQFFEAAAKRGHKGAAAMLENVRRQLAVQEGGSVPTIGGKSALPTPEDRAAAERFYREYQQRNARFNSLDGDTEPKVVVNVFVSGELDFADQVASMEPVIKGRYPEAVGFKYFMVLDQRTWKPGKNSPPENEPKNLIGFEPDWNGESAVEMGVRRTPSIVLATPDGKKIAVSGPNLLNTELARIME